MGKLDHFDLADRERIKNLACLLVEGMIANGEIQETEEASGPRCQEPSQMLSTLSSQPMNIWLDNGGKNVNRAAIADLRVSGSGDI